MTPEGILSLKTLMYTVRNDIPAPIIKRLKKIDFVADDREQRKDRVFFVPGNNVDLRGGPQAY